MPSPPQRQARRPTEQGSQPSELPRLHSSEILRGTHLILIEHAGDLYYLRQTRNNMLILTK